MMPRLSSALNRATSKYSRLGSTHDLVKPVSSGLKALHFYCAFISRIFGVRFCISCVRLKNMPSTASDGDVERSNTRPVSAGSSGRGRRYIHYRISLIQIKMLTLENRRLSVRGKDIGVAGVASWMSSVINLVNTSTSHGSTLRCPS